MRPSRPSASPSPLHTPLRIPPPQFQFLSSPLPLSDQATRENAAQKLEQASRENYVRSKPFFIHHFTRTQPPISHSFQTPLFFSLTHVSLRTQPGYMHTLASELTNEASPVFVRNAAGLALKNALTARVRRAVPPSFPPSLPPPRPPSSLTFPPGSYRTARVRLSTRPAGLLSMSRSAARSKSSYCVVFTLSRSRQAQLLRRASQLSPPSNSRRANGLI